LALGIPYGVYLLDLSLQSPQSFAQLTGLFHQWPFKVAAIVFIWVLAHQLLARTRHLLSDGPAGLLQAERFIADSRDRAPQERLDDLNDVYRLFRCRSIMNCTEVCPKVWPRPGLSSRSG